MAIKDSIGGWKDNAHVYRCPKACSAIKAFIGSEWEPFMKSIGLVNTQDCPLPPVYLIHFLIFIFCVNILKTLLLGRSRFQQL